MTRVFWRGDRRWLGFALVIGSVIAVAGGGRHPVAASQPQHAAESITSALLLEVRGLRAAMEHMASAGPRIQLSVARLQIGEQRLNSLGRNLHDVQERLTAAQRDLAEAAERAQVINAALRDGLLDSPLRWEYAQRSADVKREVAEKQTLLARLSAQEGDLAQLVSTEQARWTAINQLLDELERTLPKSGGR